MSPSTGAHGPPGRRERRQTATHPIKLAAIVQEVESQRKKTGGERETEGE